MAYLFTTPEAHYSSHFLKHGAVKGKVIKIWHIGSQPLKHETWKGDVIKASHPIRSSSGMRSWRASPSGTIYRWVSPSCMRAEKATTLGTLVITKISILFLRLDVSWYQGWDWNMCYSWVLETSGAFITTQWWKCLGIFQTIHIADLFAYLEWDSLMFYPYSTTRDSTV